jgi:hypothetical protein
MHVNHIQYVVNQRLFLLNMLRKLGLSGKAFEIIFQALITSCLIYALLRLLVFLSYLHVALFKEKTSF